MPRRDFYHDTVRLALERDGWEITNEPFILKFADWFMEINFSARKVTTDNGLSEILVKVKNFSPEKWSFKEGIIDEDELHESTGQALINNSILKKDFPSLKFYLAVRDEIYNDLFKSDIMQSVVNETNISLISFSPTTKTIVEWKH